MGADGSIAQVPPYSTEAEQAVLGGLMLVASAWDKISDRLREEDFFRRDHQLIFRAIGDLAQSDKPCDAVTLGEWFESNGCAKEVGGSAYILELASTTPSAANITAYADIVREKATLRAIIDAGTKAVNQAFRPNGGESREIAATIASAMLEISGRTTPRGAKSTQEIARSWWTRLQERYENDSSMLGLPTPWAKFNELTLGLCAGDLVVIAARPSMGKSAWATNFATCTALRGKRVMFFSLEMTEDSIFNRAVASVGDIPLRWLRKPDHENDHWTSVTTAMSRLAAAPLVIDDTGGLTALQIVARAKRENMRARIDGAIVIDHLHIVQRKGENAANEIARDTALFRALGKTLGVPVILLAQLNRGLEARPNKRPVMSDLRESGAIEQDADIIVFLYRDDYYAKQESRESEHPGMVEMIVAKQREGEAGKTVWAQDRLSYGLLEDYEGEDPRRPIKAAKNQSRGMRKARAVPVGGKDAAAGSE